VIGQGFEGQSGVLQLDFEPLRALVQHPPMFDRQLREAMPRRDLIREGERSRGMLLILEGWACCYKGQPDGARQVTTFLLPGDCSDAGFLLGEADHSIGAINRVLYAEIDEEQLEALGGPSATRAAWRHALVSSAINREWIVNVGRRTAYRRLAHLLCELVLRMRAAGLADGNSCDWPLTQHDLADATGLTAVHVNRTLQELRRDGLIALGGKRLDVPDLARLMRAGAFNSNYLHFYRDESVERG
jgi:CRP-like cAMP-binding protein